MNIMNILRPKSKTESNDYTLPFSPNQAVNFMFEIQGNVANTEEHKAFMHNINALDEDSITKVCMYALRKIFIKQRELSHLSLNPCKEDFIILTNALNWHYADMLHNVPSILEGSYFNCGEQGKVKEFLISELLEPLYLLEESLSKMELKFPISNYYLIDVNNIIEMIQEKKG